ncbi:mycothiol transferase [Rhodococcus sp. SJ-3]|uniref:mycothiol transferase n=1 Tax=Rhodococcus sp. SJ-3 TaxID=3454628 RepID=UPI003F7A3276
MTIQTEREAELLLTILGNQFTGLRGSLSGLTAEQARDIPSASKMSLASLLNHLIDGLEATIDRISGEQSRTTDPVEAWMAGWKVDDDESVADQVARLDATADRFAEKLRAESDLDRIVTIPAGAAVWLDQGVPFTVRFLVLHQIEEWARHAGHADIIRESIDGATADTMAEAP